jgi:hypothetical protein
LPAELAGRVLAALAPLVQRLGFVVTGKTVRRFPSAEADAEAPPAFVDTQATWKSR